MVQWRGNIQRCFLWYGGKIRIEPWDMFVKTKSVNGVDGIVEFDTVIMSDVDEKFNIRFEIIDNAGNLIWTRDKEISGVRGKNNCIETAEIRNVNLWDTENPYLYTVRALISVNGDHIDVFETKFGVRTISADVTSVFRRVKQYFGFYA